MTTPSLSVVAIGGNALSPAHRGASYADERRRAAAFARGLLPLAADGGRLLVVHGNGPQVGRLLPEDNAGAESTEFDIRVAQTQGELGYLLAEAMERAGIVPTAALVTRALVDPADAELDRAVKPVGPLLPSRPRGPAVAVEGRGWRRAVASPRPVAIVESGAARHLLQHAHVVAGGGGGVALNARDRSPLAAVIDKDWVATLLARDLGAAGMLFVTDVPCVFDRYGHPDQAPLLDLSVAEARRRLHANAFAAGSMAPKVESAASFVSATGNPAYITDIEHMASAPVGRGGTRISP